MKVSIEVKDRAEAEHIRRALERPDVRAFVVVVGALLPLTPRARTRVLTYIADRVDEDAGSTGNVSDVSDRTSHT